jgi:hypothetical protein
MIIDDYKTKQNTKVSYWLTEFCEPIQEQVLPDLTNNAIVWQHKCIVWGYRTYKSMS